jgi:hypothetical protein
MNSAHLTIIDTRSGGHHPTYINKMAQVLTAKNVDFNILYPNLDELNADVISTNRVVKLNLYWSKKYEKNLRFKTISLWLDIILNYRKLNLKGKHSKVFFAWADDLTFGKDHPYVLNFWLYIIKIFGPKVWSGLYFHPTYFREKNDNSSSKDLIFSIRNCTQMFLLDTGVVSLLAQKLKKSVYSFPDITDVSESSYSNTLEKDIKAKSKGRKIIALLGVMAKRKGLLQLLKVSKALKEYFFLFSGPLDSNSFSEQELVEIKNYASSNPENCYLYFHSVPDGSEFNKLVSLSDIIYAAYLNFPHSSNLLVKASYFNKPVIVSKGYLMDEIAHKYKFGLSVHPENLNEIKEAINYINTFRIDKALQQAYYLKNSEAELKKTIHKILN